MIKAPNAGEYLLQQSVKKINDIKIAGKLKCFVNSSKSSSLTQKSGTTSLPSIEIFFMYIKTGENFFGSKVFVSFQRTGISQIGNTTFHFNRYSDSTKNNRAMGRFRVQKFFFGQWNTNIMSGENSSYSSTSKK